MQNAKAAAEWKRDHTVGEAYKQRGQKNVWGNKKLQLQAVRNWSQSLGVIDKQPCAHTEIRGSLWDATSTNTDVKSQYQKGTGLVFSDPQLGNFVIYCWVLDMLAFTKQDTITCTIFCYKGLPKS